jgi:O-methyltransferase
MNELSTKNPDFVKRMVVDAENLVEERKKFFRGDPFTHEEIKAVISVVPYHHEINWGNDRLSMVPWNALEHLQKCIEDTVKNNIDGDYLETGAWRGGSCIIAKSVYDYLDSKKKVYAADSFEGLPPPNVEKYPDDEHDTHYLDDNMKASLETVKSNFQKFGLLDDRVIFLKGWFKDTMPTAPINALSILRLDGDMYESTIDVLKYIYHKLSIGGYCIIDDYQHPACRAAIQDFRRKNNITENIIKVDNNPLNEVHYWIKKTPTTFQEYEYVRRGFGRTIHQTKSRAINITRRGINAIGRLFHKT